MSSIKLADAWKIIDLTLNNNSGMRSMPSPNIGLLQLLTSAANRAASRVKLGNVQAIEQGDGKVYKVARRFFPRLGQTSVTEVEYCPTAGDSIKPLYDEVEIKFKTISRKMKIDDELMRCIKESRTDYQNAFTTEVLRNHINKLGAEVSNVVTQGGFIGNFVNCGKQAAQAFASPACKELPLFLSTGLGINPVGESILDSDRKQAEIEQQLILVGGTLLDQYRKARAIASGNDNGFDASLLDITRSIYYDTHIPTGLSNPNGIIAMAPGALQLVTYAKNQGQFQYEFEDQMRTTVVDPWLGLTHDVYMSYVKCNEEIELYVQFVTNWAVVGMPKCWAEYDPFFEGVTDVFCYNIVCEDTGYCDIEQACGFKVDPQQTDALLCTSADECDTCLTKLFAFNDADQTGTYNPLNYSPIGDIKLNIYLDYAQSIIVDSQITDSNGSANFKLAPGTYYVNYDQTYGNGTNFNFNYSLPWVIVVLDGCDTLWPGWNEDGNLPFSVNLRPKPLV
jgi:hypothetical protein